MSMASARTRLLLCRFQGNQSEVCAAPARDWLFCRVRDDEVHTSARLLPANTMSLVFHDRGAASFRMIVCTFITRLLRTLPPCTNHAEAAESCFSTSAMVKTLPAAGRAATGSCLGACHAQQHMSSAVSFYCEKLLSWNRIAHPIGSK